MDITFFQGLWFLLIFVLIAGYFVLDGFDLGAGVLPGLSQQKLKNPYFANGWHAIGK